MDHKMLTFVCATPTLAPHLGGGDFGVLGQHI